MASFKVFVRIDNSRLKCLDFTRRTVVLLSKGLEDAWASP